MGNTNTGVCSDIGNTNTSIHPVSYCPIWDEAVLIPDLTRALSGSRAALCAHGARTRRLPAHGARTQSALSAVHFAPAVPLHPALQGCPHTGSLKSPSAWLPRCPRAVLLMHSSLAARGSACPHTGPLQLRLLVLLKCNSFNRNTVLRDGRPKIGMTATPSRNRNRKHPAGTGP